MKRVMVAGVAALIAVMAGATSSPAGKPASRAGGLDLPVERTVLDNGLTVLLLENHESPTLGLVTAFRVGSSSEWDGITGSTHILEHMLFKGTDRIGTSDWPKEEALLARAEELAQEIRRLRYAAPAQRDSARLASLREEFRRVNEEARAFVVPNQLWEIYQNAGGQDMNADTGPDLTRYYLSLPANRLELWMLLESSRLRAPVLREFYTEKKNVMEERLLGIDNEPQGALVEQVAAAAYTAHRYGTLPIGWPSDIDEVTRTQVEQYFRQYYAPNRMVIAIVGDMDAKKTLAMVKEYFGDIPRQPDPTPVVTSEPEQRGERRVEYESEAEPRVAMAWHRPASDHPDEPVWQVIEEILTGGRSGRLAKRIVEDAQLAASIDMDIHGIGERYPTLVFIDAVPRAPHTTQEVESAVYAELDRLAAQPVDDRELEKAKNQLEAGFVRRMSSNFQLALQLASTEANFWDWRLLLRQREAVKQVTAADLQRVAAATFRKKNRTVGTLVPVSAAPLTAEARKAADDIVAAAVAAMGGPAIAKLKDLTTDASMTISMQGQSIPATTRTELRFPDGFYTEMSIMGQSQVRGYDGRTWWIRAGGTDRDAPAEMVKDFDAGLARDLFLFRAGKKDAGYTFEPRPDAGDGNKVVHVVAPDGSSFDMTFDAKTRLPVVVTYRTQHPMTGASAAGEDRFSDYRAVDGVQLPYQTEMYLDGQLFVTVKTNTVTVNRGIEAARFSRQ